MEYNPDKWLIVKLTIEDKIHHRVFASWYGGYLGSDSWKMNSGITDVTTDQDCYLFTGSSGSVYRCHKNVYGISGYGAGVLDAMIKQAAAAGASIEILPEETDFMKLEIEEI